MDIHRSENPLSSIHYVTVQWVLHPHWDSWLKWWSPFYPMEINRKLTRFLTLLFINCSLSRVTAFWLIDFFSCSNCTRSCVLLWISPGSVRKLDNFKLPVTKFIQCWSLCSVLFSNMRNVWVCGFDTVFTCHIYIYVFFQN